MLLLTRLIRGVLYIYACSGIMLCYWLNEVGYSVLLEIEVFRVCGVSISLPVFLDNIGTIFSSLVCFIAGRIVWYSFGYMGGDRYLARFIWLVVLFVLSINLLIFIPNSLFLLIGWDGLGVMSFLLVIYYQNAYSLSGGMVTALTNRIGDVFLILSFVLCFRWGTLCVWSLNFRRSVFRVFLLLVMVGSITKSAQVPFCSWLPIAMAAPTPVSALVHSSTLVTAGVYLLIRFNFYYCGFEILIGSLMFLSCITIIIAGVAAIYETDIKKLVALSTLRQLGFIIFSISIIIPELAFYHLCVHALFKALIFMAVGVFIHYLRTQDLRLIGGIGGYLPFCSFIVLSARLSICGFPFMSGFYSKDLIVEGLLFMVNNVLVISLLVLGVLLTVCYRVRICFYVIFGSFRGSASQRFHGDCRWYCIPILFLLRGAVLGGLFLRMLYLDAYLIWVAPICSKFIPLMCLLAGMCLGLLSMEGLRRRVHRFIVSLLFLNFLRTQYVVKRSINAGIEVTDVDLLWHEELGGQGLWGIGSLLTSWMQGIQEVIKLPFFFILVCCLLLGSFIFV